MPASPRLFRFGTPLHTGAVVNQLTPSTLPPSPKELGFTVAIENGRCILSRTMDADEAIWGLGENLGGLNKRGGIYRLFAKDEPCHMPDRRSLYGSHPLLLVDGTRRFAIFIDCPGEIVFDVGHSSHSALTITIHSSDFDLYLFEGGTCPALVSSFLDLVGDPFLPPRWAFGYQQCRYSYPDAATVRDIAAKFREHDIPCDAIYLDIDYMTDYKVFTVDAERFPDFPRFVSEIQSQGFNLIPIVDPGVKIEAQYEPCTSGLEGGHFVTKSDGKPFVGAVWPGIVHFPDFLNSKARKWWGSLYRFFTEIGITHFWNDMNEPAIFYTPAGLRRAEAAGKALHGVDDLGTDAPAVLGKLTGFWGSEEYYDDFFHTLDDGTRVPHRAVHNLYGSGMAQATAEGIRDLVPDHRSFLVVRSSYIGSHRHSVLWTGDNHSWWEHMIVQMRMMQSLNMCGFFYCGADVGGFNGDTNPELLIRWTQLGAFSPLFRNHSVKGSRNQEPWSFDAETLSAIRGMIRLRYALIPYAYTEFCRSIAEKRPFIAPLFFDFDTPRTRHIEDQFLFGRSLMVAPIHLPNARGRAVHLPGCRWLLWNARDERLEETRILEPGEHFITAALNQVPLFLKEDTLIALHAPGQSVRDEPQEVITIIGFVSDRAALDITWDDGTSYAYQRGAVSSLKIEVSRTESHVTVSATPRFHPQVKLQYSRVRAIIFGSDGRRFEHEQQL